MKKGILAVISIIVVVGIALAFVYFNGNDGTDDPKPTTPSEENLDKVPEDTEGQDTEDPNKDDCGSEHAFSTWKTVAEATCTQKGKTARECINCGKVEEKPVNAKGHKETVLSAKAASCTQTGLTEGKKCSVCGVTTKAQETVPKKAHTEEIVPAKAASCTQTGLTEGKKCSVCGVTTKAQETVPKKAHTEEIVPAKAASCTQNGLTEGKRCSVCGTVIKPQQTLSKLAHNYSAWTVTLQPTCTDSGYKSRECTACGDVDQASISATGNHSYSGGKCVDCGYYVPGTSGLTYKLSGDGSYYICTGINDYYPPSTITIPAYYNGKRVKEIGGNGFVDWSGRIKNIIISEGIESIGRLAIYCSGITSITIPNSVNYIHGMAFGGCDMLETVYISTTGWKLKGKAIDFSNPYTAAQQLRGYNDGKAYTR